MPLDGSAYLQSRGWQGSGNALRPGSIVKPLAIPQKRSLSGIGKDRDEAFPFWDHLFAAASKSITIKVSSDASDDEFQESPETPTVIPRTRTGLVSSLRPHSATVSFQAPPQMPSLLTTAKRAAAQRHLYALFHRGPMLLPEPPFSEAVSSTQHKKRKRSKSTPSPSEKQERRRRKHK